MRPSSPPLSDAARSRRLRRRVNVATIVVLAASVGVAVAGRSTSTSDGASNLVGQVLGSSVENAPTSEPEVSEVTEVTEVTEPAGPRDSVDPVEPTAPDDSVALLESVTALGDPPWSIVLVGDSLLLSAAPEIVDALADHALRIDAIGGRTLRMGLPAVAEASESGADVIAVALGTNDWATPPDEFTATVLDVMDLLADTPCVVWIDSQDFRVGHAMVNSAIAEGLATHPRSVLGSWSTVAGEDQLHQDDGYHLSASGRFAYAETIADGLAACVDNRA